MKIDFDGVQAFVAVAELGNFGKAAHALHITQTALTRRLQKLEAYLDLRLVDRTTRQVHLTPVGRDFLPQARTIVQQLTHAVERLRDVSHRTQGNVTLACIPSMTTHVLPRVIKRFAQLHPAISLQIFDGSSTEVRGAVLSGQAELGMALSGDRHPELVESPWINDPLVYICKRDNPLAARSSVSWSDLRGAVLVGVSRQATTRALTDDQLAGHGLRVQVKYEVQHHATALNLVAAGVGSAVLPSSTFVEGDRPGLRKVALTSPAVKRKVVMIHVRNRTLSPAAQAFRELLRNFSIES